MQFIKTRFNYLFNSTKGLILVAIAMVGIVTAVWGMLSGPMAEMGVREVVIKALGMKIVLTKVLSDQNQVSFSGISILIAVGVALETMKQIDSQLMMRNYEGFLK